MTEIVLTPELKKKFILFHNGRMTMDGIAQLLGVTPEQANEVYVTQIANIITEFAGEYELTFKDEPAPVEPGVEEEPEKEFEAPELPVVEENDEPGAGDELEAEQEEQAEDEEPEELEEPAVTVPEVVLPDTLLNMPEPKPIIIEANEHALPIALKLADTDEVPTLDAVPDALPAVALAPRGIIMDIEQPFVYIKPSYDEAQNNINANVKEF